MGKSVASFYEDDAVSERSSAVSSRSGASTRRYAKSGDDENDSAEENLVLADYIHKSFKHLEGAFFGILFVMLKSTSGKFRYVFLQMLIEFSQMVGFCLTILLKAGSEEKVNWTQLTGGLNDILQLFQLKVFVTGMSLNSFAAIFLLVCASVFAAVALAWFVGWSFSNNRYNYILPIKILRFGVSSLITFGFIPVLQLLLFVLECNYFDPSLPSSYHMSYPDQIQCWTQYHVGLLSVGVLTIAAFFALSVAMMATYYESQANASAILNRPHSRCETFFLCMKCVLTIGFAIFRYSPNHIWVLALLVAFCGWSVFAIYVYFLPYYRLRLNQLKIGFLSANAYAALLCVIYVSVHVSRLNMFTALMVGCPVMFIVGFFGTHYWFMSICRTDPSKLRHACHFEIASRMHVQKKHIEEDDKRSAEKIFKEAEVKCPQSSLLMMMYANFLSAYFPNSGLDHSLIHRAKNLNPAFDVRFFIYKFEKEKERDESSSALGEKGMGLIAYIEFQKEQRETAKQHKMALRVLGKFWRMLLQDTVEIEEMDRISRHIEAAEHRARINYGRLLSKHPNSINILSHFGDFLIKVSNDPIQAETMLSRAAELHEQAEKEQQDNESDQDLGEFDSTTEVGKFRQTEGEDSNVVDLNSRVCCINETGKIVFANDGWCAAFGYSKDVVQGMNIKNLMPDPYSTAHDRLLDMYKRTGNGVVIGATRVVFALHSNGYIFPAELSVNRLDEGKNVMFSGMVKLVNDKTPLILCDDQFMITGVNLAVTTSFGLHHRAVMKKHISAVILSLAQDSSPLANSRDEELQGSILTATGDPIPAVYVIKELREKMSRVHFITITPKEKEEEKKPKKKSLVFKEENNEIVSGDSSGPRAANTKTPELSITDAPMGGCPFMQPAEQGVLGDLPEVTLDDVRASASEASQKQAPPEEVIHEPPTGSEIPRTKGPGSAATATTATTAVEDEKSKLFKTSAERTKWRKMRERMMKKANTNNRGVAKLQRFASFFILFLACVLIAFVSSHMALLTAFNKYFYSVETSSTRAVIAHRLNLFTQTKYFHSVGLGEFSGPLSNAGLDLAQTDNEYYPILTDQAMASGYAAHDECVPQGQILTSEFRATHEHLYLDATQPPQIKTAFYQHANVEISLFLSNRSDFYNPSTTATMNLWEAGLKLVRKVENFLTPDVCTIDSRSSDFLARPTFFDRADAFFIMQNVPTSLGSALTDTTQAYVNAWNAESWSYITGFTVVIAIVFCVGVIFEFWIVKPAVLHVFSEKEKIFSVFLKIPRKVVLQLTDTASRLEKEREDEEDEDVEHLKSDSQHEEDEEEEQKPEINLEQFRYDPNAPANANYSSNYMPEGESQNSSSFQFPYGAPPQAAAFGGENNSFYEYGNYPQEGGTPSPAPMLPEFYGIFPDAAGGGGLPPGLVAQAGLTGYYPYGDVNGSFDMHTQDEYHVAIPNDDTDTVRAFSFQQQQQQQQQSYLLPSTHTAWTDGANMNDMGYEWDPSTYYAAQASADGINGSALFPTGGAVQHSSDSGDSFAMHEGNQTAVTAAGGYQSQPAVDANGFPLHHMMMQHHSSSMFYPHEMSGYSLPPLPPIPLDPAMSFTTPSGLPDDESPENRSRSNSNSTRPPSRADSTRSATKEPHTKPHSATEHELMFSQRKLAGKSTAIGTPFIIKTLISLLAFTALLVLWVYVLTGQNLNVHTNSLNQVNLAGQRLVHADTLRFYLRRYVTEPEKKDELRSLILDRYRMLKDVHEQLLYSIQKSSDLSSPRIRDSVQDALLFGTPCLLISGNCSHSDPPQTKQGLHNLITEFMVHIEDMVRDPIVVEQFDRAYRMIEFDTSLFLAEGLVQSFLAYESDALALATATQNNYVIIFFGALVLVFVEWFVVYRPLILFLQKETHRITKMLLLTPHHVIESVPAIRQFVMSSDKHYQ